MPTQPHFQRSRPAIHCITCSDEAVPVTVISVDQDAGTALVTVHGATEEIDISLLDAVQTGDTLLAHGGVALSRLDDDKDEG